MKKIKYLAIGLLLANTAAWAGNDCQSYYEVLNMSGPTPFGPFNGGASISIGGGAPVSVLASASMLGSASFDPANPGPISQKRAGQLLFPPGANGGINILTAVASANGTPTGPGTLSVTGKVKLTGGVGDFENSFGKAAIEGNAIIDLNTGATQFSAILTGKICSDD